MNGNWHEKTATREQFCLNGEWDFHPLPGTSNEDWQAPPAPGEVDTYDWKMKARVPGTWNGYPWSYEGQCFEAADLGILSQCLRAWYKRRFFVPDDWAGREIGLEFGGVGYKAAVYINRQYVGTHVGGVTPFEMNVTRFANPGQVNEILVYNTTFRRDGTRPPEAPLVHGAISGMWGDVYLRAHARVFANNVFVKTSVRQRKITCVLEITNRDEVPHTVSIENKVIDIPSSKFQVPGSPATPNEEPQKWALTLPSRQITIPAGRMVKVDVEQPWPNPHYWSLEDPHLYYLSTWVTEDDKLIDDQTTRFGFREFWIDGRDFRLNGEIVRLRSFPFGLDDGPAQMRPEYMRGWFKLMKEQLGHNAIRFQWIFQSNVAVEIADEEGLLIEEGTGLVGGDQGARWNWPEANAQTKQEIAEWVRARRNHPSVVIWSTNNECWSMKDVKSVRDGDPEALGQYQWILGVGDWIREHDDTRVVTHHNLGDMFDWTQPYFEEYLEAGDLMGKADHYNLHYPREYRFVAEQAELAARWAREKHKPLIVGEFSGPQTMIPGNATDFVINGEEFVQGGVAEGKSSYYVFRRVVGAWRAAGVSGIYAWAPNLYCLKKALDNHEFKWDDLTTPSMKPRRVRYSWINPGWVQDVPLYRPDHTSRKANNRFWDLLADSLAPLLINLGGNYWEHNYLSGEKVTKRVSLVNDSAEAQEITWSWTLEESDRPAEGLFPDKVPRRLAGATQRVTLARAEIRECTFDLPLPQVTERQELLLRLQATNVGNGRRAVPRHLSSSDQLDITVYPAASVAPPRPALSEAEGFPQARVAIYDKVGKTAQVLQQAGLRCQPLRDLRELHRKRHDLLVLGSDSADSSLLATSIRDPLRGFVDAGGKVLVFEQGRETYPHLHLLFPGITTPRFTHTGPSYLACSYADVAAPGHPVFQGLKRGISLWKGEYGRVAEFHYPRPFGTSAKPLLFSGKWGTSLLEGVYGKGRYFLCQENLTTRYGVDPEATILMHNLLSYALSAGPPARVRAARVGEVGGLFEGFTAADLPRGFTADNITGNLSAADLTKYDVLVLGRETLTANSEVARNASKVLNFAAAGGMVFALAQNPQTFKASGLPGHVALREKSSQWIFKEKTASPLIWGVSAFDLAPFYAYYTPSGIRGLVNQWPHPKVSAEFYDWSPPWESLLLVSKEPDNWDIGLDKPVGGVFPTGGSALLQAPYGEGRIILCQLDLDTNCSALSRETLEDEEIDKIGPRLVADTLFTNLGLPVAR
jgi:hypothetical protein